ncbi:MAG TPA: exodeoxyribonuclease VII small subunit [Ruminococcaceae bacterium]|nr:exodeoxyribonuclease VII small subunit [Oscillospiraceae bacterium]
MTFEQAMKRLEEIAGNIQLNDITLDESVKLYSEATQLIAFCNGKLENAKLQIKNMGFVSKKDGSASDEQY